MFIECAKGSRYYNASEQPPTDAMAIVIESIPTFEIWFAPAVDYEARCSDGLCSHLGFLPPRSPNKRSVEQSLAAHPEQCL